MRIYILLFMGLLFFSRCSIKPVFKKRNIVYDAEHKLALDVYAPRHSKEPKPVLVFIHGGNWAHGHKKLYRFFGKGMARKGLVSVVIDYRLAPNADYKGMATDAARSIKWVKEHISAYGGDSTKIFVSGHSAGGHLAALVATDDSYFKSLGMPQPLKGSILIDPFGTDMYTYLRISQAPQDSAYYYPVFTSNPEVWKKASPVFHLHNGMPPFLLFVGGNTYPAIAYGTNQLQTALIPYQPDVKLIPVKRKHHVGMIFQFINPGNKAYKEILEFIRQQK